MLYLIESHLSVQALADLCQQLTDKDEVVCLNDGIYCLQQLASLHQLYALSAHAQLRGIPLTESVQAIDMAELVALTAQHPTSITR